MPYPRHLLNESEDIALDLHPHWWFFVRQIVGGAVLLVGAIFFWSVFDGTAEDVFLWIVGVFSLVWAVWLVLQFFKWRTTYFVVTSERVIYRTGVLARRGVEIPLDRISNINFHQRIIERFIGTGDLEVESAGEEGQTVFDNVWHPDGVQQELYRQMKDHARRKTVNMRDDLGLAGAAAPAVAVASVPDQIEQLASLRDRGIITPEEFEAKKAELLGRM